MTSVRSGEVTVRSGNVETMVVLAGTGGKLPGD